METMTQPKITGYRQLSEDEAKVINEIKEHAEMVGALTARLATIDNLDARWLSIGRTDLQKGFMALVRSVAQPDSF
jgi:hypothetical protein